ncbi:hypothetical protein [Apilactobacillus apinorum]|uniref:Extracellular protein n=1 Tax=Apilactobacillus apinorum TaxID=1218495 RepID=A0ABP9ZG82_9LACO
MNKMTKTLLLTAVTTLIVSIPSVALSENAAAEELIPASAPSNGQKDSQNFWIHSWDEGKNPIPVTTTDNALTDRNDQLFHTIDSQVPNMTPVWGNYRRVKNTTKPNYIKAIDSVNTSKVNFRTKWFLPTGFNVSPQEHGNYQGAIMANNSIYIVESMGTGANQGAIIRLKMDALQAMGLDDTNHQNLLIQVFNFFNPFTDRGRDNSLKFAKFINDSKKPRQDSNKVEKQLLKVKKSLNKAQKVVNKNLVKYQKVSQKLKNTKKKKDKKVLKAKKKVLFNKYKTVKRQQSGRIKLLTNQLGRLNQQYNKHQSKINKIGQNNPIFNQYYQISKSVSVSPLMNIGHGQTLAYNPSNDHIYLAQDDQLGVVGNDFYNQVTELDAESLKPVHQYRFRMIDNQGKNLALHTLTFDKAGNVYFGVHSGRNGANGVYTLYTGNFTNKKISFRPVTGMIKWPASFNQFVTYNSVNDRIYLVSNDMLISIPAKEVRNDTIKPQDVHYVTFDSGREFESIAFDNKGYGYLLSLWRSELLRSDRPMN